MNSRYRERKYNTSDNDRLLRALSQPVQAWDKKWSQHSGSKTLQTFKWVKSERVIEFEEDEESEEEPEPMETDQPSTATESNTATNTELPATTTTSTTETTTTSTQKDTSTTSTTESVTVTNSTTNEGTNKVANKEDSIPGGPSSLLNKAISNIQHEDANSSMEEDTESRSQTPKLDDISDEEPDPSRDNDDDDDDDNDVNNPSKHPALAPHAQAHTTDDDMTDSAAATPQTDVTTPMPGLDEDDVMGEPSTTTTTSNAPPAAAVAHPLSQEILTGIMAQDDISSLNNDSPAIQTPEDTIPPVNHPHNPIQDSTTSN